MNDMDRKMITKIRHSSTLVAQLPPHLQRAARDSYAIGLRAVFIMAAVSTFLAYLVRLPVRACPPPFVVGIPTRFTFGSTHCLLLLLQIPDKPLDQPRPRTRSSGELPNPHPTPAEFAEESRNADGLPANVEVVQNHDDESDSSDAEGEDERVDIPPVSQSPKRPRRRRLSTYESSDGAMDLEDDFIGGSARR